MSAIRTSFAFGLLLLSLTAGWHPAYGQAASPPRADAPPLAFQLGTTNAAARAAFDAGFAAAEEGEMARAADQYRKAYEADPQFGLARAFEHVTLNGASPESGDAIERLRIRTGSQNLAESLLFVSLRERQAGRTGVANGLLDALARLVPSDPRFLRWYHVTLARGDATRVAIARTLRDREPQSYLAQGNLALALTAAADEAERTKALQEALRLGPDRPFTHWVAGLVMTDARRFDEAIAHHERALTLNPRYTRSLGARAVNYLYVGRPADARRDFRQLGERMINTVDVAFARRAEALTYLHEGNQDETVKQLTRTVDVFERENAQGSTWRNQLSLAHQHLAVLAGVRKDVAAVDRAIAAQKKIYAEPGPAGVIFWNAVSLSLAGQPERARAELASFEKLIASRDIAPAASVVAAITSMVLVAERQYDEAVRASGDSSDFVALLAKYQALTALGRTQDAREPLQRLLTATGYAADNVIVPLARMLYGRQ